MGNAFDGVRQRLREVVHRVHAPGAAGQRVRGAHDPVDDRVAQVHVGRRHVDLRPQHVGPFLELAVTHAREEVEVLRDRPGPPGAVAPRLDEGAAPDAGLFGAEAAHVRVARLDQPHRVLEQRLEVVGGVPRAAAPVESEPAHVGLDLLHEVHPLLRRIRVVEPQAAHRSRVVARDAEIQTDRLGVSDVQVAVGLGREPRHHPARDLARRDVGVDRLADEVDGRRGCRVRRRACAARVSHP